MHWSVEGVERVARMRLDDLQAQTAKIPLLTSTTRQPRLP
jgi:hypothetical protein